MARRGSTRSASRPPSTFPRQMPPRMIPITLVQTVKDEPTCRATSRLDTSSRIMMHRLLVNARAYGSNRAETSHKQDTPLTVAGPESLGPILLGLTQQKPGTPYPTRGRPHNGAVFPSHFARSGRMSALVGSQVTEPDRRTRRSDEIPDNRRKSKVPNHLDLPAVGASRD